MDTWLMSISEIPHHRRLKSFKPTKTMYGLKDKHSVGIFDSKMTENIHDVMKTTNNKNNCVITKGTLSLFI